MAEFSVVFKSLFHLVSECCYFGTQPTFEANLTTSPFRSSDWTNHIYPCMPPPRRPVMMQPRPLPVSTRNSELYWESKWVLFLVYWGDNLFFYCTFPLVCGQPLCLLHIAPQMYKMNSETQRVMSAEYYSVLFQRFICCCWFSPTQAEYGQMEAAFIRTASHSDSQVFLPLVTTPGGKLFLRRVFEQTSEVVGLFRFRTACTETSSSPGEFSTIWSNVLVPVVT